MIPVAGLSMLAGAANPGTSLPAGSSLQNKSSAESGDAFSGPASLDGSGWNINYGGGLNLGQMSPWVAGALAVTVVAVVWLLKKKS